MPRISLAWFAALALWHLPTTTVAAEIAVQTPVFAENDWPWWRGPHRDGHATPDQQPPTTWSATENVVWKAPLPGRGHGSPIIVGDRVFLATADEEKQVQSLLCFNRNNGERLWKADVHSGGFESKNKKASLASGTPACDGERVFINFLNGGAVYTTALDLDGKQLWQQKISDYVLHQGYGSSPAIWGPYVLVTADNKGGGAIAALSREDGSIAWRRDRPKTPNYPSPIPIRIGGKEQILLTGCEKTVSYDPLTGETIWETDGATTECVTSTITDGKHVFTSGGYPKNHVAAVLADGSGKIAWENNTRVYVPSMLLKEGHLYAVTDAGVAVCWDSSSGEELWKGRLGGTFSSSPVLVGEKIFAINEEGKTFIFAAGPKKFDLLATNQLGDEVFATPAICGGRIYLRVAEKTDGRRQEILYCLGDD